MAKRILSTYIIGGYYSDDKGGYFPWGNTQYNKVRFIGDTMGEVVVEYENGTRDNIPMIFGYTLWWNEQWNMANLPFKGRNADSDMSVLLEQTLCLYGAYRGKKVCAFRIAVDDTVPIANIKTVDNKDKDGECDILGIHVYSDEPTGLLTGNSYSIPCDDNFYNTHTINSKSPLPEEKSDALKRLCMAIATNPEDWENAPEYIYPEEYTGPKIYFSGTPYASIANGVISFSVTDLATRAHSDGYFPESLPKTEQYLYGGFGTFNMGTAYNNLISRNKAILMFTAYGFLDRAELSINYANRQLMYFPDNKLSILGVPIKGHFTIAVNEPMRYRNTNMNSLTKYSNKSIYGDDIFNIGNMEQDGHGMMMLSNYNVWKSKGATPKWVNDN